MCRDRMRQTRAMPPRMPPVALVSLLAVGIGCTPSASVGIDLADDTPDAAALSCTGQKLDALHAQGLADWPTTRPLEDRDGRGWLWRNAPGMPESTIRASVRLFDRRLALTVVREDPAGARSATDDPALAMLREALAPCLTATAYETADGSTRIERRDD